MTHLGPGQPQGFADGKLNVVQIIQLSFNQVENIVGKEKLQLPSII